jgi:hypothetical protein
VIQFEAMGRITGFSDRNCNNIVLVLDELNSILHQMQKSLGNQIMTHCEFNQICQWCKHFVSGDAYMDQERLDILERYAGCQAYFIHIFSQYVYEQDASDL